MDTNPHRILMPVLGMASDLPDSHQGLVHYPCAKVGNSTSVIWVDAHPHDCFISRNREKKTRKVWVVRLSLSSELLLRLLQLGISRLLCRPFFRIPIPRGNSVWGGPGLEDPFQFSPDIRREKKKNAARSERLFSTSSKAQSRKERTSTGPS